MVIGIPNNIDKDFILAIAKRMNVSEVFLYVDKTKIRLLKKIKKYRPF